MVNEIAVKKWLEDYGFTRWAVCCGTHEDQYMDAYGINMWINWENGNFRFEWMIPHSTFRIVSGEMSPVWKLDFLEKMHNKFFREVQMRENYSL